MRGQVKFFIIAVVLVALLAAIELFYPKPVSWQLSLSSDDKIPFGLSALRESLPVLFDEDQTVLSRESFYLMDSASQANGYLVISSEIFQGDEDFVAMMKKVEEGAVTLLSAYRFNEAIQDSLGFTISDSILDDLYPDGIIDNEDSAYFELVPQMGKKFVYRRKDAPFHFELESPEYWKVLMTNEEDYPVTIARKIDRGLIILNCTPLLFTNYYLLYTDNDLAAASLLSYLPEGNLHWTEFYSRGRDEVSTPLRFILKTAPLKWAYYLTLSGIFAFIFFEAKRRQRPIPIITPPRNESLDFVRTVGNLYYENGDHKNLAEKKIQYLLEYIRSHYNISTTDIESTDFKEQVSNKSGIPLLNVDGLFTMISILRGKETIHTDELRILNEKIEAFIKE